MSLPPILRDSSSILNADPSLHRPGRRHPRLVLMPISSAARKSTGKEPSSPGTMPPPAFLSERQMSALGLTASPQTAANNNNNAAAPAHKRGRARSRLTANAKLSGSTTDLSSSFSGAVRNAKLTRVHSDQRLVEHLRQRNYSDSNLEHRPGAAQRQTSLQNAAGHSSQAGTPRGGRVKGGGGGLAAATTDGEGSEDEEEEEEEREGRIIEWLIGVEDADAETVQLVVEEGPTQTDTAIHVVYEGD